MIYSFLFIISVLALIRGGSQEINTKQKNVYNTLHIYHFNYSCSILFTLVLETFLALFRFRCS